MEIDFLSRILNQKFFYTDLCLSLKFKSNKKCIIIFFQQLSVDWRFLFSTETQILNMYMPLGVVRRAGRLAQVREHPYQRTALPAP